MHHPHHSLSISAGHQLAGLFSTGRSGSTWLGSLLSSHPDIIYRFEPKIRPSGQAEATQEALKRLQSPDVCDDDLALIRRGLSVSDAYSDKPPFIRTATRFRLRDFCKVPMWALSRKLPFVSTAYRALYTPKHGVVVFKLVAKEHVFLRLRKQTTMPMIYLVRHPCATVASLLEGQRRQLMPNGRASVIDRFISDNAPELAERYGKGISNMGAHEHEAMLWRWSVEKCVGNELSPAQGLHIVFYENLCRDTFEEVETILGFLSLTMQPPVSQFIERSTVPRRGLRELGINRYFSVFRDPIQSANQWQHTLLSAEQKAILAIVADSHVYQLGQQVAGWV